VKPIIPYVEVIAQKVLRLRPWFVCFRFEKMVERHGKDPALFPRDREFWLSMSDILEPDKIRVGAVDVPVMVLQATAKRRGLV